MNLEDNKPHSHTCRSLQCKENKDQSNGSCLMWSSCWDKYHISKKLHDGPALNSILLMETLP